jgi:hypothetical protein
MVGASGTEITVNVKLWLALFVPSLTLAVMVAVPF